MTTAAEDDWMQLQESSLLEKRTDNPKAKKLTTFKSKIQLSWLLILLQMVFFDHFFV